MALARYTQRCPRIAVLAIAGSLLVTADVSACQMKSKASPTASCEPVCACCGASTGHDTAPSITDDRLAESHAARSCGEATAHSCGCRLQQPAAPNSKPDNHTGCGR